MVLIIETLSGGHRQEYIKHIMCYLNDNVFMKSQYVFLLNEELLENFPLALEGFNIEILTAKKHDSNILFKSINHFFLIRKILSVHRAIDRILFLHIDIYQLMLCFPFGVGINIKCSGIMFEPFHQIPITSLMSKFRVIRKKLMINILLFLNKHLVKIFVLNDEGVNFLNKNLLRKVFYYLPDPIDTECFISEDYKAKLSEKYYILPTKKILLIFGSIDDRKNIFNIVNALLILGEEYCSNICLLIVGKLCLKNPDKLTNFIKNTVETHSYFQIILKSEHIQDLEREQIFSACDIVMMPYLNFFGSSGVLGHAVKYRKPILGSNKGLNQYIIKKYKLGVCVDPLKPIEIALGIKNLLESNTNFNNGHLSEEFQLHHTPQIFSKFLLE